jgi:hypothetical protein
MATISGPDLVFPICGVLPPITPEFRQAEFLPGAGVLAMGSVVVPDASGKMILATSADVSMSACLKKRDAAKMPDCVAMIDPASFRSV